jgi:hypothetical protein
MRRVNVGVFGTPVTEVGRRASGCESILQPNCDCRSGINLTSRPLPHLLMKAWALSPGNGPRRSMESEPRRLTMSLCRLESYAMRYLPLRAGRDTN